MVAEAGDIGGFLFEAGDEGVIVGKVVVEDFEGDVAVEVSLVCFVDASHGTLAEAGDYLVFIEMEAG